MKPWSVLHQSGKSAHIIGIYNKRKLAVMQAEQKQCYLSAGEWLEVIEADMNETSDNTGGWSAVLKRACLP